MTTQKAVRKYEAIWLEIVKAGEGRWVDVRFQHPSMMQTIINMVQNEKCEAAKNRRQLGMPRFGKLKIKRQPELRIVSFTLENSGADL